MSDDSKRKQIRDAMVEAWNTDDRPEGVPELTVSRFRQIKLSDSEPISGELFLHVDEEKPDSGDTGPAQMHEMTVGLELRAIGDTDDSPDDLLDPSAVYAVKVFNDNSLNGLATFMRVSGSEFARDVARSGVKRPVGKLLILVLVKYVSDAQDFTQ